jgi:hypothetical protein
MKISEMTPEQKREYNRNQKRRSRANHKAAEYVSTYDEWTWHWDIRFPEEAAEVREYEKQVGKKVAEELGRISTFETLGWSREKFAEAFPLGSGTPEAYALNQVTQTLFGFKKNTSVWVHEVVDPNGIIVSGSYFPDVLGSEIVSAAHGYGLKTSQTFVSLYEELLQILDTRYGKEPTEHSRAIKAELAGEYVLKLPEAKPEPRPEAAKPEPKPTISTPVTEPKIVQQIPSVNWSEFNKHLDEQAGRYLAGIPSRV